MKILFLSLKGMAMGIAESIPGISGSTISVLLGIYDEFINFVHSLSELVKVFLFFLIRKKTFTEVLEHLKNLDYKFAVPLFLGMGIAILAVSRVILILLEEYPAYVYAFLIGLVLPCVKILYGNKSNKFHISHFALTLITFLFFFILFGMDENSENNLNPLYIFFGGYIGISAMILPGISGSFILLIMGIYTYIISLIKQVSELSLQQADALNLLFFIIGMGLGFLTFVRLIKFLFQNYRNFILAFLIGLVLASSRVLYPFVSAKEVDDDIKTFSKPIHEFAGYEVFIIATIFIITNLIFIFITVKDKKINFDKKHK